MKTSSWIEKGKRSESWCPTSRVFFVLSALRSNNKRKPLKKTWPTFQIIKAVKLRKLVHFSILDTLNFRVKSIILQFTKAVLLAFAINFKAFFVIISNQDFE